MKLDAIFSWKRMCDYDSLDNEFFWNFAKLAVGSASQYHNTVLYTDKEGEKDFKGRGIMFNRVIILPAIESITGNVYCMPKIHAMMNHKQPYVHLDFDTWTNFEHKSEEMFGWGYPEVNLENERDHLSIEYMYTEYFKKFKDNLEKYFDPAFTFQFDYGTVPNFGVFICNNPSLATSIYKKILWKLKDEDLDNSNKGHYAMLVEQFLFFKYVESYKIPYTFTYKISPFSFETNNRVVIASTLTNVNYQTGIHSKIDKLKFVHFNEYKKFPTFSNTIIKLLLKKQNPI